MKLLQKFGTMHFRLRCRHFVYVTLQRGRRPPAACLFTVCLHHHLSEKCALVVTTVDARWPNVSHKRGVELKF